MSEEYTAKDILVLTGEEVVEAFDWAKAGELTKTYPWVTLEFVTRLLEACRVSGWAVDLAIQRYLDRDKTVEQPQEFVEVYRDILIENRFRNWR
jgi:hypothetical protein